MLITYSVPHTVKLGLLFSLLFCILCNMIVLCRPKGHNLLYLRARKKFIYFVSEMRNSPNVIPLFVVPGFPPSRLHGTNVSHSCFYFPFFAQNNFPIGLKSSLVRTTRNILFIQLAK